MIPVACSAKVTRNGEQSMAGSPLLTVLSAEAGCLSAPVVFEPTVRQQIDPLTNDAAIVPTRERLW
jgi:hypothetical protein